MNPILFGIVFGAAMIYIIVSTATYKPKDNDKNKKQINNNSRKEV